MRKAFVLYLWLILFTMFVTVFSIILFNYLGNDIKVTKRLIQETKYINTIKNIALIATEMYKNNIYQGRWNYRGKIYNFTSSRINITDLHVRISNHNNQTIAETIVKDRYSFSDLNLFVAWPDRGNKLEFEGDVTYSSFSTFADEMEIGIPESKIFNIASIKEDTRVNGKGVTERREGDKVIKKYENLEELKKYSNYAYIIDEQLVNYLQNYYSYLRDFVKQKSQNRRTFQDEFVDLTTYGSIYIAKPESLPGNIVNFLIFFSVDDNSNQEIFFKVFYPNQFSQINYRYYLVTNPKIFNIHRETTIITNDTNLSIEREQNRNYIIILNPNNGFVYKVLLKYDGNNSSIEKMIIYKTSFDKTIIYSTIPVNIDNNNDNFQKIKDSILLISESSIRINTHVLYADFQNINDFINFVNGNQTSFSNNNYYFSAIANEILINKPSNDDKLILSGDYVAFYEPNSKIVVNNNNNFNLYVLGSNIAYQRSDSAREKFIIDSKDNPLKSYFYCFIPKAVDINKVR